MANGLKGNILRQHADIEFPGIFDHLSGQVSFLHGDGQLGGLVSHLEAGIADTAIVFVRVPGADYKQSVGQIEQRRGIFSR